MLHISERTIVQQSVHWIVLRKAYFSGTEWLTYILKDTYVILVLETDEQEHGVVLYGILTRNIFIYIFKIGG
jgi:hypothetical protein